MFNQSVSVSQSACLSACEGGRGLTEGRLAAEVFGEQAGVTSRVEAVEEQEDCQQMSTLTRHSDRISRDQLGWRWICGRRDEER